MKVYGMASINGEESSIGPRSSEDNTPLHSLLHTYRDNRGSSLATGTTAVRNAYDQSVDRLLRIAANFVLSYSVLSPKPSVGQPCY